MMRVESVSSVFAGPVASFLVGRSGGDRLYAGRDESTGQERFALFSCLVSMWEAATGETTTVLHGLRRHASRPLPEQTRFAWATLRARAVRLVRDTWDDTLGMTTLMRVYKWHERTADDEAYRDDGVAEIVAEVATAFHEGRALGGTRFNMLHQWLASARDDVFRSIELLERDIDYEHLYAKLADVLFAIEGIHLSDGVFGSSELVQRAFGVSTAATTAQPTPQAPLTAKTEEEDEAEAEQPATPYRQEGGTNRKRKEIGKKLASAAAAAAAPVPKEEEGPATPEPPSTLVISAAGRHQSPPPSGLVFALGQR
jgi:hypothetical protein